MTTPALQRRTELQAEIDFRYAEMQTLENAANRETMEKGLAALVEVGAWLEVDSSTEGALRGTFAGPDSRSDFYAFYGTFGFESNHDSIDTLTPSFRLMVEADDGQLHLTIWHNTHHNTDKTTWPADLAAAKAWLTQHGIVLKTAPLEWEESNHLRLARELGQAIKAIQS